MNSYLAMQQQILADVREQVKRDARHAAARVRDTAAQILVEIDADDLATARARFSELAHLLPQYLAPIDDHLKEAEIVARIAANMAGSREEAAR